jgi:hypothetical protein
LSVVEAVTEEKTQTKETDSKNEKVMSKDMSELLFKSPYDEVKFDVAEIFNELEVSMNVCESQLPEEVFQMTPKKLF